MLKRSQMKGGFSVVGVMVASFIGIFVIMGLTQLGINTQRGLAKSQREFNLMVLKETISQEFSKLGPNGNDAENSCTNSLKNYYDLNQPGLIGKEFKIIEAGTSGRVLFEKRMYDKVRIDKIQFYPIQSRPQPMFNHQTGEGMVKIHFSTTEDTKERLSASIPLQFKVKILSYGNFRNRSHAVNYQIKKCRVDGINPIANPLADKKCPSPGMALVGFDVAGKPDCKPLPLNPGNGECDTTNENKILVGFDNAGKIECRPLVMKGTGVVPAGASFKKECDPGEAVYGFDTTTGEFLCRSLSLPSITQQLQQLTVKECPPGKNLRGFKANGEIKCDP